VREASYKSDDEAHLTSLTISSSPIQLAALFSNLRPNGCHRMVFSFAPVASPLESLGHRFIPVLIVDDQRQIANPLICGDHGEPTTGSVAVVPHATRWLARCRSKHGKVRPDP